MTPQNEGTPQKGTNTVFGLRQTTVLTAPITKISYNQQCLVWFFPGSKQALGFSSL